MLSLLGVIYLPQHKLDTSSPSGCTMTGYVVYTGRFISLKKIVVVVVDDVTTGA